MTDETPPLDLEQGEKLLHTIRSDRGRYLRDHGIMAVLGGVLALIGNDHVAIGALGAVLAIAARGIYLMSEQLGQRWWLTNRRLILPGARAVFLAEVEAVRKILGDVQVVTRGGDKHLIKHVAAPEALMAEILGARDKRLKSRR